MMSDEIRQAARLLLDASISRLTDDEAIAVAEQWQHQREIVSGDYYWLCRLIACAVPCLQPNAERESVTAALALFLSGHIAAEKYALLSVQYVSSQLHSTKCFRLNHHVNSALTDISKSITLYLHDEQSIYRVLAIDLCSRGFHVWQHYVDSMEILRALFLMATTTRKESITSQNVGAQARLAVLHIAATNTPLFMTTLGLDILNPVSLEHRRSMMQIVAFLIRKVGVFLCSALLGTIVDEVGFVEAIGVVSESPEVDGGRCEVSGSQSD